MKEVILFLRNVSPDRPPAVILGGESTHGLAFVRSLGRKGIPVLSIGNCWRPPMRTRYGNSIVQPCEDDGEAVLLKQLQEIGKELAVKGVLIPCGDDYVLFLSRNRAELASYFDFVIPDESSVEALVSKKFQYRLARDAGIPIPETFFLENNLREVADEVAYPCILKPAFMHLWTAHQESIGRKEKTKVLVANSAEELTRHGPLIANSGLDWMVQELVEGGDDQLYAFYAYFDRDSELLASFVRRKLRQHPVEFGSGCYSVGVRNDDIVGLGLKLLQPARYRGLTNIEFKRDARDGRFKLIEINVRCAAQASLPIDSGVDLPYIAYQDALGREVQSVSKYRQGVKWINLAADLSAFLEYRRRGQLKLGEWLASVARVRSFAYLAWDDPMPAVAMLMRAIRIVCSRTRK